MDVRSVDGKTIIMDGAHNGQKMTAFWQSYNFERPDDKPIVLFALKKGKEVTDIVPLLKKYSKEVIVTSFDRAQDMPILSMEPSEIDSVLSANGVKCTVISNPNEAYKTFLQKTSTVGVITGSFFLISQLRERNSELR